MSQAIIVMDNDINNVAQAFSFREVLLNNTNLQRDKIFMLFSHPYRGSIKDQLKEVLSEKDNGDPLLLTYIGHGSVDGWGVNQMQEEILKYTDLKNLLEPFKSPLLFINATCHSQAVAKICFPFPLIQDTTREFGIITPIAAHRADTIAYFLETEIKTHWQHNTPYDPEFWNEYGCELILGRDKPFLEQGEDGFNYIRMPATTKKSYNFHNRARFGKMLDYHFWRNYVVPKNLFAPSPMDIAMTYIRSGMFTEQSGQPR